MPPSNPTNSENKKIIYLNILLVLLTLSIISYAVIEFLNFRVQRDIRLSPAEESLEWFSTLIVLLTLGLSMIFLLHIKKQTKKILVQGLATPSG